MNADGTDQEAGNRLIAPKRSTAEDAGKIFDKLVTKLPGSRLSAVIAVIGNQKTYRRSTLMALIGTTAVQFPILAISAIWQLLAQARAPAVHDHFQKNKGDVV